MAAFTSSEEGCQMAYFQTKNPNLGKFWMGWEMGNVDIFYDHLVYFTAVLVYFVTSWYILWLFGTFLPFWYVVPRKIWQPWLRAPARVTVTA
jgi:hypothetical protein